MRIHVTILRYLPRMLFRWHFAAIASIILLYVLCILIEIRCNFPTRNEVAHVPAGLSYLRTGRFHVYRVNPPLSRVLQAVPVLLVGDDFRAVENAPDWAGGRPEWHMAYVFANDNSNKYLWLITVSRLTGIVWALVGLCVAANWAFELYGVRASILAAVLWIADPNILAHSSLSTPDFPCAVMCLVASYSFHSYLLTPSLRLAMLSGVLLGLAQLTKFTALVDCLSWLCVAFVASLARTRVAYRTMPLPRKLNHALAISAVSVAVINLGYLCEGTLSPLGNYDFVSAFNTVETPVSINNAYAGTWAGNFPVPLPENYVRGLDLQQVDFEGGRKSYLRGQWSSMGWWYFYLYATCVKVPIGTLVLCGIGFVLSFFRRFRQFDELIVWIPAAFVIVVASSKVGYTMHFRYVLPALPFAIVGLSKAAEVRNRWARFAAWVLAGSSVASSFSVFPHSLAYFNVMAGGPDRGYEHLVDSNIDWGQDLFFLHEWSDTHPDARPLGLAYFNYIDYRTVLKREYAEVPPDPPTGELPTSPAEAAAYGPHPGWYAADIYNLMDPSGGCHYLMRHFKPVAKAGYSIFIYHITPEEADRVRREMGLPPLPPASK